MRPIQLDGRGALDSVRGDRPVVVTLLLVMLAGAVGVAARFALDALVTERAGDGFPWATLGINVAGSFLLGMVALAAVRSDGDLAGLQVPLSIGLLGGFTTFSSFALEAVTMAVDGAALRAVTYVVVTNVAGLVAAAIGVVAARLT